MKVLPTKLRGVLVIDPSVFGDTRGFFMESFNAERYAEAGISESFVQDNVSLSQRGVLRGLHLQHPHSQGKLVQVFRGEVFDVVVDARDGSPTFGQWIGEYLSEDNRRQLYVPAGFAHGFLVTSDEALFAYKCTDYYHPEAELSIRWDDPRIGIEWPTHDVSLSTKDSGALLLDEVSTELLPSYAR